jgi:hypothetical protein
MPLELQPDEPEDPREALNEVMFDILAAARIAEGLAQQTDLYTPVLIHAVSGLARALQADADRLRRVVVPSLSVPPLAVKDGELEHASRDLVTPAPAAAAEEPPPAAP